MNIACNAVPYPGKDPFVYIHFSEKDQNEAFTLTEMLAREGYRVWYAPKAEGFEGKAEEKAKEVGERIRASAAVIALYSAEAACDHQFRKVVTAAVLNRKQILPVFLEDTALSCGMKLQIENSPRIHWNTREDDISELKNAKGMKLVKGEPDPGIRVEIRTPQRNGLPQNAPEKKPVWGVSVIIEDEEAVLNQKKGEKEMPDSGTDDGEDLHDPCCDEMQDQADNGLPVCSDPEGNEHQQQSDLPEDVCQAQQKDLSEDVCQAQQKDPSEDVCQAQQKDPSEDVCQAQQMDPPENRRLRRKRRLPEGQRLQIENPHEKDRKYSTFPGAAVEAAAAPEVSQRPESRRYVTEAAEDMRRTTLIEPQEQEQEAGSGRKGRNGTLIIDVIDPICIRIPSGEKFRLNQGVTRVGRSPSCDVCIREDTVSSEHLEVISFAETDLVYKNAVRDCGSSNGTWVNGKRLEKGGTIRVNDCAMIGLSRKAYLFVAFGEMAKSLEESGTIGYLECLELRDIQVLYEDDQVLGRSDPWNNGFFDDPRISWEHARLTRCASEYRLTDQSSNGTIINGKRIAKGEPVMLADGDLLIMGRRNFVFRLIRLKGR